MPQRRALDGAGVIVGLDQHGHGAAFDHEGQERSAQEHDEEGQRKGGQRGRIGAQGREDRGQNLAHVAAKELLDVGVEQQHDQEDAADDRDAEDQLQRRFGDELHHDERPVGGGDERTALEGRLQGRCVRHRHTQFTFAVSCLTSGSALSPRPPRPCPRAVGPSSGELAAPAGGRPDRGGAGVARRRRVRALVAGPDRCHRRGPRGDPRPAASSQA